MYVNSTQDIRKVIDVLHTGRVAAFPTGTSYGLAADALQGHALQRLRNLKERPEEKTFTVFLDESKWDQFFHLTLAEKDFLAAHANSPLTLLVKPRPALEHLALEGRVGLRVIDHPTMRELAQGYLSPLTATSANVSGHDSSFSPERIRQEFPGRVDETTYDLSLALILDVGELPPSKPSTIVRLEGKEATTVRPGAWKA